MHEAQIAEDMVSIVLETAKSENLKSVSKINLCFGRLIQIVPDIFENVFRIIAQNTIAGSAELYMEIIPVRFRCTACGKDINMDDQISACSSCGSENIDLISGKELYVKSIEGE